MAAITWAMVELMDSRFEAIDPDRQDDILAVVNAMSSSGLGGDDAPKFKLARIYRAAHQAELELRKGPAGAVYSETVAADSISTSYADNSTRENYRTTSWGELYLGLSTTSLSRVPTVWPKVGC